MNGFSYVEDEKKILITDDKTKVITPCYRRQWRCLHILVLRATKNAASNEKTVQRKTRRETNRSYYSNARRARRAGKLKQPAIWAGNATAGGKSV